MTRLGVLSDVHDTFFPLSLSVSSGLSAFPLFPFDGRLSNQDAEFAPRVPEMEASWRTKICSDLCS